MLNRRHRIFDLYNLLAYAEGAAIQQPVDLDILALNRFLGSGFDPEYGSVVPSIFADCSSAPAATCPLHRAPTLLGSAPLLPRHP